MIKIEKIYLLYSLLKDMRGSFPKRADDNRLTRGLELSKELGFDSITESIEEYIKRFDRDGDGRWFRDDCEDLEDKFKYLSEGVGSFSEEFKEEYLYLLEYPEYVLGKE